MTTSRCRTECRAAGWAGGDQRRGRLSSMRVPRPMSESTKSVPPASATVSRIQPETEMWSKPISRSAARSVWASSIAVVANFPCATTFGGAGMGRKAFTTAGITLIGNHSADNFDDGTMLAASQMNSNCKEFGRSKVTCRCTPHAPSPFWHRRTCCAAERTLDPRRTAGKLGPAGDAPTRLA